ncbi:MAG: hypothetical protein ACYS0G_09320 [Planctomycetota bacterium]|jgi:hypothetical protein
MLTLADVVDELVSIPNSIFVIGGIIAVAAIIFTSITKIMVARSRERTRREIAAYVAEGTIDPDHAVAMLNAGESRLDKTC